nr:DoxX family protein [uncultured Halomonas sp.]
MTIEVVVTFLLRFGLVALFFPFSAWYVATDFPGARAHAMTFGVGRVVAGAMMVTALFVEVVMSLGILTGVADRLCALVLAGFCVATALLYKRFWRIGDFAMSANSRALPVFWDFLKNIALAAGFLLIAFGTNAESIAEGIDALLANPLASTNPYEIGQR